MVEIKELVVRAIIASPPPTPAEVNCASSNGTRNSMANSGSASSGNIDDCVRQVLAILERQKDR